MAVLSVTALIMGGILLIRSYAHQPAETPPFEVIIGENQQKFTGLFVLDPNFAPADSLELLPGIGKTLADRIVAHRQHQRGPVELHRARPQRDHRLRERKIAPLQAVQVP